MREKGKRKKFRWQQLLAAVILLIIGGACGVMTVSVMEAFTTPDTTFAEEMLLLLLLLVTIYVSVFLQTIIHEAGHLIFGLLSGYRFSSFRIFSFMWLNENGRIRLRRLSLAGTGGQCLMVPPDMKDGKIPVVLYNLGGSILNAAVSAVFLAISFAIRDAAFSAIAMRVFAIMGLGLAIVNGIPMRLGTVDNDGYNALSLGKNPEAMRAFWVQLKVNEQIARGVRLRDMPREWFAVPEDNAMKNSLVASLGVFACNRLMDAQKFAEAERLMAHLSAHAGGMNGLHRNLMQCDRIYCELIGQNRTDAVEGMLTAEQKKFMKQMKSFPSVIRTEYGIALLRENDMQKAEKAKAQFEKCAKHYPYPSDIQSERELMEIAQRIAEKQA